VAAWLEDQKGFLLSAGRGTLTNKWASTKCCS